MRVKKLTYENGLQAVVQHIPGVRSVAVGYWVATGSRHESRETSGLSHFTEHMLFKGTDKRSPEDIANAFENFGANVNAFTGKEYTCYYYKSIDEYKEDCFKVLSEIFFDSAFPKDELDKERKVIVEEINMVEDSPEDLCFDLLSSAVYGDAALGRTILGPIDNVLGFSGDDIRTYMRERYTADNVVIAFAGSITLQEADRLIKAYALGRFPAGCHTKKFPNQSENKRVFLQRIEDFEQSNIALSFPSIPFADKLMSVQSVLNIIVGGGMSSRLFQSVRERQGLAYSVYSSPSGYRERGTFNILLNVSPQNSQKAVLSVRDEIDRLLDGGIAEDELNRAKVQLKSALIFSSESVQTQMTAMGKLLSGAGKLYDMDERVKAIGAVQKADVDAFLRRMFDYRKLNAAYVGRAIDTDLLTLF